MSNKEVRPKDEDAVLELAALLEKAEVLAAHVGSSGFPGAARDQLRNLVGLDLAGSLTQKLRALFSPLGRNLDRTP